MNDYKVTPNKFTHVHILPGFWKSIIETVIKETIPFSFKKCEDTGRIQNFINAAKRSGKYEGDWGFNDSDVYKIIEGASYSLLLQKNKELENYLAKLSNYIQKAQESDGYLFTPWTLKASENKPIPCSAGKEQFENSIFSHELYCAGHLYEAAVAHYLATQNRILLDVAIKNADMIYEKFILQGMPYYPGHQEIEIGLIKLYRITEDKRYLELAKEFLERRGNVPLTCSKEQLALHEGADISLLSRYMQAHVPVTQQTEAVGHAVRAVYMYAGMADIAALTQDEHYLSAINTIWENVVGKKLYITGGVGSVAEGEAFGADYDLPNVGYAETCAAIANVFWNHRMFLLTGESKYIDVLERTLYNGVLPGMSLDGKQFFYANVLSHDGKYTFNRDYPHRLPWFDCSCCPSNVSRFIPSIGQYIYAQSNDCVYINLFINSETKFNMNNGELKIKQTSQYPWNGRIRVEILNEKPIDAVIKIRNPGWSRGEVVPSDLYKYQNDTPQNEDGYITYNQTWKKGDIIDVDFEMIVKTVIPHNLLKNIENFRAFEYGPIVYCAEGIDNDNQALDIVINENEMWEVKYNSDILGGVNILKNKNVVLIPYYSWNNRGDSEMSVWFKSLQ